MDQSAHSLCQTLCFWTDENLPLGVHQAPEKENTSLILSNTLIKHDLSAIAPMWLTATTPLIPLKRTTDCAETQLKGNPLEKTADSKRLKTD